jgi:hypothetical protein
MPNRNPRVDRLEGVLERIASEQTELRQDMRDLRQDMHELRYELLAEIRSLFNTLLTVSLTFAARFMLRGS